MNKIIIYLIAGLVIAVCVLLAGCSGTTVTHGPSVVTTTLTQITTVNSSTTLTQVSTVAQVTTLSASQTDVIGIIKKIAPSICRIDVTGSGFTAGGSGFFVDARGYVITNEHVVSGAISINVTLMDNSQFTATVVGSNSNRDMAMLKLATSRTDFPVLNLGSSTNAPIGEDVITGGFPLGTDLPGPATFDKGILSAFRNYSGLNYLQTDANINPGNSGSCMVDSNGDVLGIIVAGILPASIDAEAINLAIPIDEAKTFITDNVGK